MKRRNRFLGYILLIGVLTNCTQIDRINSNDPDGIAYNPPYYIPLPLSSSSVVQPSSSSAVPVGVYCIVDAGEFGKFCSELVYDNCEAYKSEGYSVEVASSCGGI